MMIWEGDAARTRAQKLSLKNLVKKLNQKNLSNHTQLKKFAFYPGGMFLIQGIRRVRASTLASSIATTQQAVRPQAHK
eukprot:m.901752 g.901752  ORF g.901752 m.901752 type:complete len:78 (-) comp23688_c0_seq20:5206-5439(-)